MLQESASSVAEVIKVMDQYKILVKVYPEGRYIIENDDMSNFIKDVKPGQRVALRNDTYMLHKILPSKIDPLVSLMMVEKVPDSTFDQVGGLDNQVFQKKIIKSFV